MTGVLRAALAEARGQEIHKAIEAALEVPAAPQFEPSPILLELHATARRLEREQNCAHIFNPRLGMRLRRAQQRAAIRWAAEVRAFEAANPAGAAESEAA